jgi:hypothetical protein
MVESQPSKLLVAGSIPVSRSRFGWFCRIRWRSSVGRASDLQIRAGRFYGLLSFAKTRLI